MDGKQHSYDIAVRWTGNRGDGTRTYGGYSRDHEVTATGKPVILGSSDPAFRGDPTRYNPEECLVAALSTCHMLWFLHLCADARIVVTDYQDAAHGVMIERADGGGRFTEVTLRPRVRVQAAADEHQIASLHERAHQLCYIASSVNFPVRCEPRTTSD